MEGDNVTLHTGLTEVQSGDVIDWRFGPNAILIARVNRAAGTTKLYDDVIDGRDRLYINQQIGDLIITNIRTEHSGLYKLSIHGRNKELIYNVSGEYVRDFSVIIILFNYYSFSTTCQILLTRKGT